jgi:ATP-dependent DNA helicase RecQ
MRRTPFVNSTSVVTLPKAMPLAHGSPQKRQRSEDDDAMKLLLKEQFGLEDFRPGQRSIIEALLRGENALAIFPTGGGKSLCYQLPALMFPRNELTLVISPLIALMKDQVDALKARGIAAEMLGSSQTTDQKAEVRRSVSNGFTRILFVAPEQVNNEGTRNLITGRKIALLAIDEAHCISEWGHAFRPDYLRLQKFASDCGAHRVLCLTATATPQVASDICSSFNIPKENCIRTTFHRPNLRLSFRQVREEERDALLASYLKQGTAGGPTIVYATQQEKTETIAKMLASLGIVAKAYHAGMETDARTAVQEWFMKSDSAIVVATIAFGMGIDKSNIRRVVHYNLPKSLEGYAQEIGRAGRDGLPSECVLYYCPEDLFVLESFARCDSPSCRSVFAILDDFFKFTKVNGLREVSHISMARAHDVQENVVKMLLAFVDVYHQLVESTTPKYSNYKIQSSIGLPVSSLRGSILSLVRPDAVAKALAATLVTKMTWGHIDMDAALRKFPDLSRESLVNGIGQLESSGQIRVGPEGLLNVYKVKALPTSVKDLAMMEHARLMAREKRELARLQQVVDFIRNEDHHDEPTAAERRKCHCQRLLAHFAPDDEVECPGHCQSCANLAPPSLERRESQVAHRVWADLLAAVASGTIPQDDPRLLTRLLIGSRSPRITSLKLGSHRLFGVHRMCSYDALLAKCEELCNRRDSEP